MSNTGLKPLHIFLITFAVCALVAGLWYTFSYQTKQTHMTELHTKIEEATATRDAYKQAEQALPALKEEVEALTEERAEFVAALPQTTQMANVLTDMRQTAEETGVIVNGVSVGGGGQNALPGGVRPITLNLTLEGTYSEAYRTLQQLETLNRFTTIDNLGLQMGEPTSQDPELNGSIGMTVYTFDPNMAAVTDGATGDNAAPPAPPPAPAPAPTSVAPTLGGEL